MYSLRKIGFYVSLTTLIAGTLAIIVMLIMGVNLTGTDNPAGAIFGIIFVIIALLALLVIAIIVFLMIIYQKSFWIPLLFLLVFGLATIRISATDSPLLYITAGLTLGPFITLVGYLFKAK